MSKTIKGKIRKIRKSDLIQCQDIIYSCLNLVCDDKKNIRLRKHYSFVNLQRYFKSSKVFYVFEYKGSVLGVGRIDSKNQIRTIYVDPKYHKQGIGKIMIAKLEKYLQSIKVKKACLIIDA